ncbi:MAG: fatty acid-binding protein DegV [Tenericutes bacterium HGW-Tenericutes-1]|jgi:DegV family protein with EDD domain|nr:MAG: fatty acid-binding protein DegV [Tenericutes bacterium HGW-Tenericutes-1]
MQKIKLISDSTCDLSKDLLDKHQIDIVPLFVNFKEDSYLDGVTLTVPEMYKKVDELGFLPKTAAASPGSFVEVFEKYVEEGYEIIYFGIGAGFSGTLQSANSAKQIVGSNQIHLIDSANLSSGSGLLMLKAAKFIQEGDDCLTIIDKINTLIPKVRTQFVINTMDYLYKGGRCSGMAAIAGTILKIKPIIKVVNGAMTVGKKPRGRIEVGIDVLIEELMNQIDDVDEDYLMITHSMADESARYIKNKLNGNLPIKNIYETNAGCVISSHCGQGCIGILYIMK